MLYSTLKSENDLGVFTRKYIWSITFILQHGHKLGPSSTENGIYYIFGDFVIKSELRDFFWCEAKGPFARKILSFANSLKKKQQLIIDSKSHLLLHKSILLRHS